MDDITPDRSSSLVLDFTSVGPDSGGVGVVASGIATGLADNGIAFTILTNERLGDEWSARHPAFAPHLRRVSISLDSTSSWQNKLRRRLPRNALTQWFIGHVRRIRTKSVGNAIIGDVVWAPFHRSPIAGDRTVVTVHDLRVFEPDLASSMDQRIIADNLDKAAAVVCSWPHPYRSAVERFPNVAHKIFLVPLPVLNPGPPVPRSPDRRGLRLLLPAYVTPHKNQEAVIRALALRPDWRVVFTGSEDRSYGDFLRALAEDLGVSHQVEWKGFVSAEELEEAYRETDLLVMPTRWEAASGPLYEAIVRELPFVASDIPPIKAQLASLGLQAETFPWDDPQALVAAVDRTVEHYPDHVEQLRRVAPRLRSRTWGQTAQEYDRVFRWAAGDAAKPSDLQIG